MSTGLVIAPSGPCRYSLRGDLDAATADALARQLAGLPPETSVVLDLSRVGFMDTVGLRAIIEASERLDAVVILEAPSEDVGRFLEVTEPSWRTHAVVRDRRRRRPRPTPLYHDGAVRRGHDPVLDWS